MACVLKAYGEYLDHVMTCAACVDHGRLRAMGRGLHRACKAVAEKT
ncbi:hypothetical protein OG698_01945 [Streptomyces sp. NBC_01003]|nr:hypothetical protein OG698_01945 [Streptomyces sp. NBC_01003]